MDWLEIIKMALVGVFSGGAATWLTTIARARAQNKKDIADASQMDAAADAARATAFENLWKHVNSMEDKYAAKLETAEKCYQAGIEEVREQLLEDIRAKDIENRNLRGHIERLDSEIKTQNSHIARLNAESIAREKKYDALQAFTEGVIAAFMSHDAQLRAAHITPAASLPPKPKTGPLD